MLDAIQLAAKDQFDKQSARYGKSHILADIKDVEYGLSLIPPPSAGVPALDVATGAGHTALHLASVGYEVTASDLSAAMLEQVALAARERGLNVARKQHPAEELPYPDGSFALVASRVAPHHFSDQAGFIREVARVLRPGGHFLLIDGSVHDEDSEAEEWLHQVERLRDPSHQRFLAPKVWARLCVDAGLRVTHSELQYLKQPDLEWYFETAATPEPNRKEVRNLIGQASPHVRQVYRVAEETGKTIWWWPRLLLVAEKRKA